MDPPRGNNMRYAIALLTKADQEGLHVHKLEYIELEQVNDAIKCLQKLRKLSKRIHPESSDKRSHAVFLCGSGKTPGDTKKARTLQAVPTEASLNDP